MPTLLDKYPCDDNFDVSGLSIIMALLFCDILILVKTTASLSLERNYYFTYFCISLLVTSELSTYDELQTVLPTLFDQSYEKPMQLLRTQNCHLESSSTI
jgi:hypothetical protein